MKGKKFKVQKKQDKKRIIDIDYIDKEYTEIQYHSQIILRNIHQIFLIL